MPPASKRPWTDGIVDRLSMAKDAEHMRLAVDTDTEHKRFKSVLEESAAEFVCPITQELPVDPVTAEDGRVYERKAIEEWLARGNGKSPSTNEQMGGKLLPALQVKNMISIMVRSGALSGDIVQRWQQRLDDEERVQQKVEKARAGDVEAMVELGNWYKNGTHGLRISNSESFGWFKLAALHDDTQGMYCCADAYHKGSGCERNETMAVYYITRAAEMGNRLSAYQLARAFVLGVIGLPKDRVLAKKWYLTSLESAASSFNELPEEKRVLAIDALGKLDELEPKC